MVANNKKRFLSDKESTVVRDAYDIFRAQQEEKMGSKAGDARIRSSRSMVSQELYQVVEGQFKDDCGLEILMLWELLTAVLQIGEQGLETTNAAPAIINWHRRFVLDPGMIDEVNDILQRPQNLDVPKAGSIVSIALQYFFSGEFSRAAEIMDGLVTAARLQYRFSRDEEQAMTAVFSLLVDGARVASGEISRSEWQHDANKLLTDARCILDPDSDASGNRVADLTRGALLDVLLMMSCDENHVLTIIKDNSLGISWYVVAQAVLNFDQLTLVEAGALFTSVVDTVFRKNGKGLEWWEDVVGCLLTITSVYDCIDPLCLIWNNVENDGDDATEFCGKLMVSHLMDVCTPERPSNAEQMKQSFKRNELLMAYTEVFQDAAGMWSVAAKYALFTPLADPQNLVSCVKENCLKEIVETSSMDLFEEAMALLASFSSTSALQGAIRAHTKDTVLLGADSLNEVFSAVDGNVVELKSAICETMFNHLLKQHRYTQAVVLGVKYPKELHEATIKYLRTIVEGTDCVSSKEVQLIGEAVHAGLITLPPKKTKLRQLLQLTAYLSDVIYSTSISATNDLQDMRITLRSTVAAFDCDDREHLSPETSLSLVESVLGFFNHGSNGLREVAYTQELLQLNQCLSYLPDSPKRDGLLLGIVELVAQP